MMLTIVSESFSWPFMIADLIPSGLMSIPES